MQAQADLLEVESQISEEEALLDTFRLAEQGYSLTKVGEKIVTINELKTTLKAMKAEFESEFE